MRFMSEGGRTIRQERHNFLHLFLETDFQYPIGFVDNQALQIAEDEAFGILKKGQLKCTECSNEYSHLEVIE